MPEYLSPGVFIDETGRDPKPIEGVSTSTAAFLGETERGTVRPSLVTSFREYARLFGGGGAPAKDLPYAVRGFFENAGQQLYVCRIASSSATYAEASFGPHFALQAIGPGNWGTRVYAKIEDSSVRKASPLGPVPVGFRLRLAYYATEPTAHPGEWFNNSSEAPEPEHSEDFDNLVADEKASDYWHKRIDISTLARLVPSPTAPAGAIPAREFKRLDTGGLDGAPVLAASDFQGEPVRFRHEAQGLTALAHEQFREVSLVYAPGASFEIAKLVIQHCEDMRYWFAIIDAEPGPLPRGFDPRSTIADSKYAALYYPWIVVANLVAGQQSRALPPGGHVAGVYARTDRERGVHKAPANEILRGALGVTVPVNAAEQGRLDPLGINVIRDFRNNSGGVRVYGGRVMTSDWDWKYVNVRRLRIFIEASINRGLQWVVFEPNAEPLWTRVRRSIVNFLTLVWRNGALAGIKAEEAFFVKCDRTTMTQDDIDNGRLICEIGIAPIRPSEFVIFRIVHHTAGIQA